MLLDAAKLSILNMYRGCACGLMMTGLNLILTGCMLMDSNLGSNIETNLIPKPKKRLIKLAKMDGSIVHGRVNMKELGNGILTLPIFSALHQNKLMSSFLSSLK